MSTQLLKGNIAIAEAAIRAGCEAYFGYPITPQTELLEHMSRRGVTPSCPLNYLKEM
jgi:2-oxoglutarate ferredoxin oxidoreductase subunit alpha